MEANEVRIRAGAIVETLAAVCAAGFNVDDAVSAELAERLGVPRGVICLAADGVGMDGIDEVVAWRGGGA